jgi:Putative phage tail protein
MPSIADVKELECADTPLFLIECTLKSGDVQRWSTHQITAEGQTYEPRVLRHNLFEMKSSNAEATDGISKISVTLANADGFLSPIQRTIGWKGARVTIKFSFFSLANATPASDSRVVFRGIANAPDESNETGLKLTFTNRLNLQRIYLPETRVQKKCPWTFPADADQRKEAQAGAMHGKFSSMYRCGYSADVAGGAGNLNGSIPFTACDGSRIHCQQRGMFNKDGEQNVTARFGGVEFVPPSIVVRSYREKGTHLSTTTDNQAKYNDSVPLVYGTGWYQPPIIFARNDGNLTHMEVLLGAGTIASVVKVVVNNLEMPVGSSGTNMTATGWYNVVTYGGRNGTFNSDFVDATGSPVGDPYGSMAVLSVVVPNAISDGRSLPSLQVLVRGLKLTRYDQSGASLGDDYTNNPAWVLLDVLQRSGWMLEELDLGSFASAAQRCDEPVQTMDVNGNSTQVPRFQCNLILTQARSAADVVRGIRNGSGLFLNFNPQGLLRVCVEDTLAGQQGAKPDGSNSIATLNGGWPAYEFGDNSLSGIAARANGESSLRVYSRSSADSPNRFTVEFQDEFNGYQQDSYSIFDSSDATDIGQEISAALPVLGIPNYDQATRTAYLFLSKAIGGNTYVDFDTSVKSVNLVPGDVIALTYAKEGFSRQPFRIVRIAPGMNYRRVTITAQLHDDAWYSAANAGGSGSGRQGIAPGTIPRPLIGAIAGEGGSTQFHIAESVSVDTDGTSSVQITASFIASDSPSTSAASIPLLSLEALYTSTGGTLDGNETWYYAVSGIDGSGAESPLSFTVCASIPAGSHTNSVTLQNLSFSATVTAFNVYRGPTPANLSRIASQAAIAAQFTDSGLTPELKGPPDPNFDHANFYWRFVVRPTQKADIHSANTIGVSNAGMHANEYRGSIARVASGLGAGQERAIVSNTDSTLTVAPGWDIRPDDTSEFLIADASWHFGATATSSPVAFSVPNRAGAMVQISGRAANVHDDECAYELSPLSTWKISGGVGSALDQDVPAQPTFGLYVTGQGAVEVVGIGFADLTNTRGIAAGTLSLLYWDEIAGTAPIPLANAISDSDQSIALNASCPAQAGDVLQIESELVSVQQIASDGKSMQVSRSAYGTAATAHANAVAVYALARKTFVMPFPKDFFGTPASGSYAYRVVFPSVRIAASDFFVTNSRGNSNLMQRAFTSTIDGGLRTLTGGQISIQIEGLLAIQANAAPPLIMDAAHSVRDIFANVGTAPSGASIDLQVTQNGTAYCALSIPAGATVSNVVDGGGLPPLGARTKIGLDVVSVPQASGTAPGSDLTVSIRL